MKDAAGRLTGILRGAAAELVRKVIPPVPFEQRLVQVRAVLREARESGVTTIQDLTSPEQLRAYQHLLKRGDLTARIILAPHVHAIGWRGRGRRARRTSPRCCPGATTRLSLPASAPGLLADLAVLDTNLVEAGGTAPAKLLGAKVIYTVVGGRIVYERGR